MGRRTNAARPEARNWVEKQAERRGELRLQSQSTAVVAHRVCLAIGVVLVAIGVVLVVLGLTGVMSLLPYGPIMAVGLIGSGVTLLRWVAGGRGFRL